MSNKYNNRKQVTFTFSFETIEKLNELSKQQHTNKSQCLTNLIWSAINQNTTKEVNDYGNIKQ